MILNTQGYVVDRRIPKVQNGLHIEITTFQGEHRDEYCVKEVSSGRFSLFRKGVLQMNGKFVAGTSTGDFTTYTMGKAKYRYFENSSRREDGVRYVENCKNGLQLVVEGNDVIYRGGFDSVKSMKREGKGVEYDEKSGRVLRCGVWKHDELFQVIQEFESEDMMIEYELKEGEENVSVLNRHPVYEGGYVFEEESCTYLRDGDGCEIEGGIASREGKWERGTLIESVNLFDGWYVKMDENDVLDWRWPNEGMDPLSNLARQNEERVAELVIPSACCNECSLKQLDVSGWKELKRIEIGDDCFGNVDEVKLIGLSKLESVVIGKRSFTKHKNGFGNNPSRHFCLKDCERLKELKIGNYSFSDYTLCRIEEVDSLEIIAIGDWTDKSWSFYWADLELKRISFALF